MKKLLSTLLFLSVIAIISLSAQSRIYPPTLKAPADSSVNQMPDVTLDWAAVGGSGGIVEYEVQLDTDPTFATATTFARTEFSGLQMEKLLFIQDYYWRVRAWEGEEVSDWSTTFFFTTFEMLKLSKPNDGADEQNPDVEFKIKASVGSGANSVALSGVEIYEIYADTSENFDSPLLYIGHTAELNMFASSLHFGETYYWKARATHSDDESEWSELRTFIVIPTVELDKPVNNASDLGLENVLKWDEISGVIDYRVEIADNDAFTGAFGINVEGTEYTTDGFMTFGSQYFWRVRANHATDTSDWSEPFNFTTTSTVFLSSPADGAENISINPLLEWDMVTGVDYFQVQYNNTNSFEEPCCNELIEPTDNFFQVIYILDYSTTIYWRCRTMKGIDTTDWSEIWSFTTRPVDYGIEESAFDKSNISVYPNPVNDKLFIDVESDENANVNIYVMDLLGHIHIQQEVVYGQGNTSKTIDMSKLANGLYIVKLTRNGQSYSQKITIHK